MGRAGGPRDFPSTAYQTLQGFPFRPPAEFLQPAGNVKFRSFEINSAPRDCAAFTRLEYLASERYSRSRYQSFRILQRQSRNVSYWANETGKGISDFSARGLFRGTSVPFLLLNGFFSLHNATLGVKSLRVNARRRQEASFSSFSKAIYPSAADPRHRDRRSREIGAIIIGAIIIGACAKRSRRLKDVL